jgi:hypothetical protein
MAGFLFDVRNSGVLCLSRAGPRQQQLDTGCRGSPTEQLLHPPARSEPTDWAVLSIWDATIYPKRSELGYPHPFISQFMYQNVTGDFDNMMIGGSIVLDWPEIFRFYGGLYIDEWSLTGGDFFEKDRNMYALQTGIKAPLPIPALPWSRLVFQYTKLSPTLIHIRRPRHHGTRTTMVPLSMLHLGIRISSRLVMMLQIKRAGIYTTWKPAI